MARIWNLCTDRLELVDGDGKVTACWLPAGHVTLAHRDTVIDHVEVGTLRIPVVDNSTVSTVVRGMELEDLRDGDIVVVHPAHLAAVRKLVGRRARVLAADAEKTTGALRLRTLTT